MVARVQAITQSNVIFRATCNGQVEAGQVDLLPPAPLSVFG